MSEYSIGFSEKVVEAVQIASSNRLILIDAQRTALSAELSGVGNRTGAATGHSTGRSVGGGVNKENATIPPYLSGLQTVGS